MPVYTYTGINDKGKKTSGIVEAEGEKFARSKLRKMGVYPTSLKVSGKAGGSTHVSLSMNIDFSRFVQKVKTQDIAIMTRQLATLVASGIPLVDSLQALEEQTEHPKLKPVLSSVREKVTEGGKLSDAMRGYPKIFNELYVNMINAGENSGALDLVLERLAEFTEKRAELTSKVTGALIYPIIMAVVGVLLMGILLVTVIPKITVMIESVGQVLPLSTKMLIWLSDTVQSYWYLIILFGLLATYGIKRWRGTEKGRAYSDKKLLRLPLFGKVFRMIAISRFSRTLATLLSSGVPLLLSMDITRNIISNVTIKKAVEETKNSLQEGASVAEPLKKSGEFPPMVTHMIAVGEKTGQLEKMLERIADAYDMEVDNTISNLMTVLSPVMVLGMAGAVAFAVMAIIQPMMTISQAAGQ